jgi:hypothetical protein
MNRFRRTFLFVLMPLAGNIVLAVAAFHLNPSDFHDDIKVCYLTVAAALNGTIVSFLGFEVDEVGPRRVILALLTQGATLIFVFAGIYRGYGLVFGGEHVSLLNDWKSPLYFSVVTWTTLGYGDFTPPPELRLITAMQAILRYIFFGLAVGLWAGVLSNRSPSHARSQSPSPTEAGRAQ